jgi:hypothetical protein
MNLTIKQSALGTPVVGSFTNLGGNLPSGVNLKLTPLANNGGPAPTHAFNYDSPLVNAGSNPGPLTFDQRGSGFNRVAGSAADIGAFELQAPGFTGFTVNDGAAQRSRLTTVTLNFANPVSAIAFQTPGAVKLTRTIATPTGALGTVVDLSSGLIVTPTTGTSTSINLNFANIANAGVEKGSLADGYWQISAPAAGFTSTAGATTLRRFFGDSNNDGTIDGTDFGDFGAVFARTIANLPFDQNNDGTVDGTDFAEFGARFARTL